MAPIFEIGDNVIREVAQRLKTNEEELNRNVEVVRKWMEKQPHLPEVMENKKIQNFLILNKGNVERAKEKIDQYYTLRTKWTDIFENINPKKYDCESIVKAFYLVPLPKLTKDLHRVYVFKIRDKDLAADIDQWDSLRNAINGQELRLKEDVCYGDVFIIDCENVPLKFVLKITPLLVYRAATLYESVYSMRIKGVYLINASPAIEKLMIVVKSFIKAKIASRMHFCHDYDFLKSIFENRILPKDYGGEEISLGEIQKNLLEKAIQFQDLYDRLDTLRVNEKLRPLKNPASAFTRYFSFRRPKRQN